MKYRKKPVVIDAVQFTGDNWADIAKFSGHGWARQDGVVRIATLEGVMIAQAGDWIIRGVQGELYPCKPDIFEATYEEVT